MNKYFIIACVFIMNSPISAMENQERSLKEEYARFRRIHNNFETYTQHVDEKVNLPSGFFFFVDLKNKTYSYQDVLENARHITESCDDWDQFKKVHDAFAQWFENERARHNNPFGHLIVMAQQEKFWKQSGFDEKWKTIIPTKEKTLEFMDEIDELVALKIKDFIGCTEGLEELKKCERLAIILERETLVKKLNDSVQKELSFYEECWIEPEQYAPGQMPVLALQKREKNSGSEATFHKAISHGSMSNEEYATFCNKIGKEEVAFENGGALIRFAGK